jgi:hypothetical protein
MQAIDIEVSKAEKAENVISRNWDWTPKRSYPRQSGFGHHRIGDPDFYRIEFENQNRFEKAKQALQKAGISCFTID